MVIPDGVGNIWSKFQLSGNFFRVRSSFYQSMVLLVIVKNIKLKTPIPVFNFNKKTIPLDVL